MQSCQKIMQYRCENCKFFWGNSNNNEHGECHRYPPVVIESQQSECHVFPHVTRDNFCGEFCDKDSL